ncbi:sugar ABC transporter substrate-binding protein [Actinoalloteichus hymeniacidonis]|uniref:ABC-type sugar transport system, periplasmic component n=1 Tax=Actinoalloteichus hymeniacidonis TaxID=340345 RepID=A0AAC9MXL7_9PSEU|nr:substrate-binding domain-containing protein [Actinoalloteichus hymeniacidonis]AOS63388.1 ABC-type sugar transport system, periplasmic component [Actinoalloteichus hymeniacidonis]MBB5908571.1 ribose transport system substrate-binding protein [Actinoalloteichus hymeniacidonis]
MTKRRRHAIGSRRRPRRLFALWLVLGLTAVSCSTGTEPVPDNARQDDPIQVGAIMYARDLEFWQLVEAGMRSSAAEHEVPINIDVSNRELQTESQLMDTMYARGDNVLVAAPFDLAASASALQRARHRGMTIVQYDNRVHDDSFGYFVGVDQAQLGAALGEITQSYVDENLGGTATAALLVGDTEPNGPPRRDAFLGEAPGLDVLTTAEAVGSPEEGSRAFETVLQAHPDVDVVWAWNGAALQGAVTAAQRLDSDVAIFGIDMSRQVADAMSEPDSPVHAVADQHAYDVGRSAVDAGIALAKGQDVPPETEVEPVVYTREDQQALATFYRELEATR